MKPLLQVAVCITLVLCIAVPVAESGTNECTVKYAYFATKSRTVYYTERYTSSCGWCGWSRCTRNRRASYTQYYKSRRYGSRVECCPGWRRDRYGRCSMAICYPSCVHGTCIRPNYCQCRSGFTGSTCSRDIDECMLQSNSVLQCDHMCINSIGSYRCECNSGYLLDSDRHACNNVDECSMTRTHNCHQICTDNPGSFTCDCYKGYTLDSNRVQCDDLDECTESDGQPMVCEQLCRNLRGSYECSCHEGYEMNGGQCEDIDECATGGGHDCDQLCTNGEGNFTCSCNEGYELGMDGKTCFDIDECAPTTMNCDKIRICQNGETGQGTTCSYVDGSYTELQFGPTGVPSSVNCSELQICRQIGLAYTCACVGEEGHALSNVAGIATDGCDNADPSNTTKLLVCRNSTGTLSCSCVEGYQLIIDNTFCWGEDLHNCTSMQNCKNTKGGYECPCKDGYLNNTETGECDDIDECSTDYMSCPDVQICYTNTTGTIVCECLEGDLKVCQRGECSTGCADLEVCVEGDCECYPGYFLNAENMPCKGGGCGEMIHDCTDMETCNNTIGGYECPCMNGFVRGEGVNATCDDIDECREKTDGCHHLCMNGAGNYSCACVEGYNLFPDNHSCAMPMSLHQAVMLYQKEGDVAVEQPSQSGWLFPFGMICAFALIAAVVLGRKKSERVRNATDRAVEMAQSLQERVVSTVSRRRSRGTGSTQSNIYVSSPGRQPQLAVDDEMGDAAVYSANSPSPRGGNQTIEFDDADVYQVPTGGHNAGPSMVSDIRESIPQGPRAEVAADDDDDAHYLFDNFSSPESIPNTEFGDVYESYDKPPETETVVDTDEELYLALQ